MKTAKIRESPPGNGSDVLDRLEEFIEKRIEKHLRKGLAEAEKFLREEILRRDLEEEPGPLSYVEAFLKDKKVAALVPSTKFIVERVLKRIDWATARVVIEYGPAEGVITKRLLERLPADGVLAAVETNGQFVSTLSKLSDPRLRVFHGSVMNIDDLLSGQGLPRPTPSSRGSLLASSSRWSAISSCTGPRSS